MIHIPRQTACSLSLAKGQQSLEIFITIINIKNAQYKTSKVIMNKAFSNKPVKSISVCINVNRLTDHTTQNIQQ